MTRALVAIALSLLATGCVAQLTQAGSQVRRVQADWATRCEFLGVVEASWRTGATTADFERGAMNELRNKVAERGGNAYSVSNVSTDIIRSTVQGDAYKCPPTPGEQPAKGAPAS